MTIKDDDKHDHATPALLGRLDERTSNLAENQKSMADALKELQRTQLSGTDRVLDALAQHAAEEDAKFDKHDGRIKALENWRWYILGALATIGILITLFK
jgi:hypothetical protein